MSGRGPQLRRRRSASCRCLAAGPFVITAFVGGAGLAPPASGGPPSPSACCVCLCVSGKVSLLRPVCVSRSPPPSATSSPLAAAPVRNAKMTPTAPPSPLFPSRFLWRSCVCVIVYDCLSRRGKVNQDEIVYTQTHINIYIYIDITHIYIIYIYIDHLLHVTKM